MILLNVVHTEREQLVTYFTHPKVTNKKFKPIIKKLTLLGNPENENAIVEALDVYAVKLFNDHMISY